MKRALPKWLAFCRTCGAFRACLSRREVRTWRRYHLHGGSYLYQALPTRLTEIACYRIVLIAGRG